MFAQFFSVENLFESSLFIALATFSFGLMIAYLFWGIRSGVTVEAETATKLFKQKLDTLRESRDQLQAEVHQS